MYSHILTKLFLSGRDFAILVVLSLASSTLLSSSFILTSYIINSVVSRELSRLSYHLIIYSYSSRGYVSSIEIAELLTTKLNYSKAIYYNTPILVESKVVEDIVIGNATINVSPINIIYIPGLNITLTIPYGKVREKVVSSNTPRIGLRVNNTIGKACFEAEVIFREEDLKFYLIKAYMNVSKNPYIGIYEQSINPYTYILDKLRMSIIDGYDGLFILTGMNKLFFNLTNETTNIGLRFVKLKLDDVYYIGEQSFSKKNEISGSVVLSIINLNVEEFSKGYGAAYSINKIFELISYLRDNVKPYELGLLDDWVIVRLINIKQGDQQFRLAIGITLLPIMFVVWIILTKTPSFLISLHRREIALLKIRGISSKIVFKGFLLSVLIYATIGVIIGILVSPILPSLILRKTIDLDIYIRDLELIIDPSMIALVFGLTYALFIGHLINGLREISMIEPSEFIRKTFSTTYIEKPSTLFYILLVLTIYITLRYTILNPFKLLYSYQYGVVTQVIGVILLVLEPIATLFGPIIVVYTLSKLMISFPNAFLKLTSNVTKLFTRRYHGLIAKLSRTKLNYLALAMITSYFSLSLLFGSVVALELTRSVYERSGSVMHGDFDFIIYKPISVYDYSGFVKETERAVTLLNGSNVKYSVALLILGYTPLKGENIEYHSSTVIQEDGRDVSLYRTIYLSTPDYDIPITYILFIDNSFPKIAETIDELSYTGNFGSSLESLIKTNYASIYVFNSKSENIVKKQYLSSKPYVGDAEIKFGSKILIRSKVLSSARNVPLATAMVRAGFKGLPFFQTELPYSGLASLPIVTPVERGLIMRINDFEKLVSETRSIGYRGSYFGYLMVLCKDYASIPSTDGFKIYHLSGLKSEINKFVDTLCLSHKFTLFTSICLYITSLLVLSILAYSIVLENAKPNALMIGRGVSTRDTSKLCIIETLSLLIICIAPGVIAGFMIGYGLSRISMQVFSLTEVAPVFIDEAFGIAPSFIVPLPVIIAVLTTIVIPLTLALMITSLSWRKTLKESIKVLTGV